MTPLPCISLNTHMFTELMNLPKWWPKKLQVGRHLHLLPLNYGMILLQHVLELLKSFF